jgi:hypothetical protein
MRRLLAILFATAALIAAAAVPASAAPGSFPDQPGTNVENACGAVNGNPGTGIGGRVEQVISPTGGAIVGALLADACGSTPT